MAAPDELGGHSRVSVRDVSSLPQDVFLMILRYLEPWDIIRVRRVSRLWQQAFSNPLSLSIVLRREFPLAREVRKLHEEGGFDGGSPKHADSTGDDDYWRVVFDQVTARYFHLSHGKSRSIQKHALWVNHEEDAYRKWYPVQPWDCHKSHPTEKIDFLFEPTFWTYDDGLLVYPSDQERCLLLLDIATNRSFKVPFEVNGKVIRRMRLQERVLAVEWAEPNAFHWLNEHDGIHRHFASLFDIAPSRDTTVPDEWTIIFRNELKIMFLGHPLSDRDRFFSSHNRTHYTIYAWQPNRSLYTADEDAPIESLFVWDVSKPSSYRPSEDPSGSHSQDTDGPQIVARFGFRDLAFYSVRQRGVPAMTRLDIDSEAGTVDITENACKSVQLTFIYSLSMWIHKPFLTAHTISIPFISHGPCWRRSPDVVFPAYRGNSDMQTTTIMESNMFKASVSRAADEQSRVCFSLIPGEGLCEGVDYLVFVKCPRAGTHIPLSYSTKITAKGRIAGDERFVIGENSEGELVILRFDK